ncbi:MAG: hypothetical protein ABR595_07880 [Psychroflexus sp.]
MFKSNHYKLKVYSNAVNTNDKPCFFILNKGLNSGRPSILPCRNCFVVKAETEAERDAIYWLTYAAWQTKKFMPYIKGSVIPYLTTADTKMVLDECLSHLNHLNLKHKIKTFKAVQEKEALLKLQLEKFGELKIAIAATMLK